MVAVKVNPHIHPSIADGEDGENIVLPALLVMLRVGFGFFGVRGAVGEVS